MSTTTPNQLLEKKGHLYQMLQVVMGAQAGHGYHRKILPILIEIFCPQDNLVIQFSQTSISSYANTHELQKGFAF